MSATAPPQQAPPQQAPATFALAFAPTPRRRKYIRYALAGLAVVIVLLIARAGMKKAPAATSKFATGGEGPTGTLSPSRRDGPTYSDFQTQVKTMLQNKGWVLYAMKQCPACIQQMKTLGGDYSRAVYSQADVDKLADQLLPPYASITHFPTWVFPANRGVSLNLYPPETVAAPVKIVGSKTLEQLTKM